MDTPSERPTCDSCGRDFAPRANAPHKRFCSLSCRNSWHANRRAKAMSEYNAKALLSCKAKRTVEIKS